MTDMIPQGLQLAGVHCGIKKQTTTEDLSLFLAQQPAVVAGVYTQNVVFAASVERNRELTPSADIRLVVVNSGNANTCTGRQGRQDNEEIARLAAEACGCLPEQTLVMSTGIIGECLPMENLASGIQVAAGQLGSDKQHLQAAARGMMTTDKFEKISSSELILDNGRQRITGIAKGAGMIGPRMATMLAVLMTDAALTPEMAQQTLSTAVEESFNCISVEGHMSTSDTVLLVATGSGSSPPLADDQLAAFQAALTEICVKLARMIPDDGEGASHLITIDVQGCQSRTDARQIAQTIANSALVKTGIAGNDPNWGRILCAAGYAGVPFDPEKATLQLNGTVVYQHGEPKPFDEAALSRSIGAERETSIVLELAAGHANCQFWTSDLTIEYVRFNSDYHT